MTTYAEYQSVLEELPVMQGFSGMTAMTSHNVLVCHCFQII